MTIRVAIGCNLGAEVVPGISAALKISSQISFGDFIPGHDPKLIAQKVNEIIENKAIIAHWKKNLNLAVQDLSWETEEHILKQVYGKYV